MEKDELVVSVFLTGFLFALGFGLTCAGILNYFYYFPSMSGDVSGRIDVLGISNQNAQDIYNIVLYVIHTYWESSFFVLFFGFVILFIGLVCFLYTLNKVHKALTQ